MKVILCCGSAGAIEEFTSLIKQLEQGFDAAIVILLHRKNNITDYLVENLRAVTKISVTGIEHLTRLKVGEIFVVPGGYHCLLNQNLECELEFGEKELYCRPAANISLESFSHILHHQLVAVIASGSNQDGARGIKYVAKRGGKIIIQNPENAAYPKMPKAALAVVEKEKIQLYNDSLYHALKIELYGKS